MAEAMRGMPLLSGPPPNHDTNPRAEMSCRKCNKEFNMLFTRAKKCYHCGYSYCSSCTDYQALMPRLGPDSTGYDCVAVCAFCIEYLTITAGGKAYLRSQPLSKLRKYLQAYDITLGPNVIDKDDVIDAIINSRGPTGCLPKENEEYYRLNSVPNGQNAKPRGIFARATPRRNSLRQPVQPPNTANTSTASIPRAPTREFPRPDLDPEAQNRQSQTAPSPAQRAQAQARPQTQSSQQRNAQSPPYTPYTPRPRPASNVPPPQAYTPSSAPRSSPSAPYGMPGAQNWRGPAPEPTYMYVPNFNAPRTRATSTPAAPPPPRPPTPVPSLAELLSMTDESVAKLSIASLKAILFQNHVNARLVIEKGELVARVKALVNEEKRERERNAAAREREDRAIEEMQRQMREEAEARKREEERQRMEREMQNMLEEEEKRRQEEVARDNEENTEHVQDDSSNGEVKIEEVPDIVQEKMKNVEANEVTVKTKTMTPEAQEKAAALERNGLCVICQDEEANIAIVDCGHLALCRGCSDLIMQGSKECPLCRTRIITPQRLLRIFKT